MKRLVIACALIALVILANIYAYIAMDRACAKLSAQIEKARMQNLAENYGGAIKTLEGFDETFERYETVFLLLVRRELFYEIKLAAASLRPYANDETKHDFDADAERTMARIAVLRQTLLRFA